MTEERQKAIARLMQEQGRTQAWLAERTGYSRNHISQVLAGERPMTPALHGKILDVLGVDAKALDQHLGRVVRVPLSVFRREVSAAAIEASYEEAWKADWVAEHAEATLATAAERAYAAAHEIAAAGRRTREVQA